MWNFLDQLFGKKRRPITVEPWVKKPIKNEDVMKRHPFFQQDPEKWITAWLDVQKAAGNDYYALVKANPKCKIVSVVDALCYDLADAGHDCMDARWQFYYPNGMPVAYLADLHLIRIVWQEPGSDEKHIRQVDVSMIYRDLVQADVIAP